VRLFIGIPVPTTSKIKELLENLELKGKKVKAENLHITLKFIGEVKSSKEFQDNLRTINYHKFNLVLQELDAFPKPTNGRVLFIKGYSEGNLEELAKMIHNATKNVKLDHPFKPHLTIMRLKEPANLSNIIERYKGVTFGTIEVTKFNLYESKLTSEGPIYRVIEEYQLM